MLKGNNGERQMRAYVQALAGLFASRQYSFDLFAEETPMESEREVGRQPAAPLPRKDGLCLSSFEREDPPAWHCRSPSESPPLNAKNECLSAATFDDHISSRKMMQQCA